MSHVFVNLGDPGERRFLFEADRSSKAREVLWGDWLKVDGEEPDGWLRILWSPRKNPRTLFIPRDHTTDVRPLEIVFVDVGQGDGAVLITPETDDREGVIVVDAGKMDNMKRFLNGRFSAYRGFEFDAAVITHPDNDHYLGFEDVFGDRRIGFRTVWHNGLIERAVSGTWEKIGRQTKDPVSGRSYFDDLGETGDDVRRLLPDRAANARYDFPKVMQAALDNPRIRAIDMLSTAHGRIEGGRTYMPGYAPSDGRDYAIEVLGPVVEPDDTGRPRLRKIGGSLGETKNGHSILLRLTYGSFSVFFGGDLNEPAEKFLLAHYGAVETLPRAGAPGYDALISRVAERFRSDVMKVCHHGSEKVTDAFMAAVHPACFIISSGDAEGHIHPRPDLLGRLGRAGRGASPVLLSTELQRSTREKADEVRISRLREAVQALHDAPGAGTLDAVNSELDGLSKHNVDVYGAVYLKTDGRRLITAVQIETGSEKKKWFYYEYVFRDGELVLAR